MMKKLINWLRRLFRRNTRQSTYVKQTIKYRLHPGLVQSADGDVHYIMYNALIKLYKLDKNECIEANPINHMIRGLIDLYPSQTGDYSLPVNVKGAPCSLCNKSTWRGQYGSEDYYSVVYNLWSKVGGKCAANKTGYRALCLDCLIKLLGRDLTIDDLSIDVINYTNPRLQHLFDLDESELELIDEFIELDKSIFERHRRGKN